MDPTSLVHTSMRKKFEVIVGDFILETVPKKSEKMAFRKSIGNWIFNLFKSLLAFPKEFGFK
jgi:hypothetical protein